MRHESITDAAVSETAFLRRLQELLALQVSGVEPRALARRIRNALLPA